MVYNKTWINVPNDGAQSQAMVMCAEEETEAIRVAAMGK
jgi:hypothetical protein